jgi:hypothetical protein
MSIRARVEDAIVLQGIGRPEGALLSALVAVAATSRRRYPQSTGKRDGEAFKAFTHDEMKTIAHAENCNVGIEGELQPLQDILYHWMRCGLAHEGALSGAVLYEPDHFSLRIKVNRADGSVTFSHGLLVGLVDAVVSARENSDQFGSPPVWPIPIYLPKVDLTVGPHAPATT